MKHAHGRRTHHLHLVLPGSTDLTDKLGFRDLLRASPEMANRYVLLIAMALCSAPTLAATPVTCFNDDDPLGRIGIWTYEGPVPPTPSGKVTPPTLALGYLPGRSEYKVADLWYCFYTPRAKVRGLINCRSGSLRVAQSGLPGLLSVEYEFILSNGEIKTANYDAAHCGQPNPY